MEKAKNPCLEAISVGDRDGDGRWMSIHQRFLGETREKDPDVVFIGDSVIQALQHTDTWTELFAPLHTLNFGVHRDLVQNVLWRVQHGELDHVHPRAVILHVGTNNHSETAEQICEGILHLVHVIRERLPDAYVVLPTLLPRGQRPNAVRERLTRVNELLRTAVSGQQRDHVEMVDVGNGLVQPDGSISHHDMHDYLLLTNAGSRKAFEPLHELLLQLLAEGEDVERDLTPSE